MPAASGTTWLIMNPKDFQIFDVITQLELPNIQAENVERLQGYLP